MDTETEATLTFYIVFHKELYEKNTEGFTNLEISHYFRWVAVNEKIPKIIPTWIPQQCLLKEYEMDVYSPLYQMLNFYQNSAFFHLFWNHEKLVKSKYIGFAQYDMSISAPEFRSVLDELNKNTSPLPILVAAFPYHFNHLFGVLSVPEWNTFFIEPYNKYFQTNHTLESISQYPLLLLHTFILPTEFFLKMMPFILDLLPTTLKSLTWNTKHLGGTLERVIALCISCGIAEGKFSKLIVLKGIEHRDEQHSEDTFRGIPFGCSSPKVGVESRFYSSPKVSGKAGLSSSPNQTKK